VPPCRTERCAASSSAFRSEYFPSLVPPADSSLSFASCQLPSMGFPSSAPGEWRTTIMAKATSIDLRTARQRASTDCGIVPKPNRRSKNEASGRSSLNRRKSWTLAAFAQPRHPRHRGPTQRSRDWSSTPSRQHPWASLSHVPMVAFSDAASETTRTHDVTSKDACVDSDPVRRQQRA
jgi:hypothetical protein